jgi:glycosyltransferase involved in cell wall biosynthesis
MLKRAQDAKKSLAVPAVSVVVPTYKRPALLERCLTALLNQQFNPLFEVVIADDAASADTERQVDAWRRAFSHKGIVLRYIAVSERHGPAAARNQGWRAAKSEIIAFTDDDCVPQPGWLAAGVNAFSEGIYAVRGKILMPLPPSPTDYEKNAAGLAEAAFVTANCFCLKKALRAVGGFDENFTAAWREDSDLLFNFLERGGRIAQAPAAQVTHPIRPERWGISLKQQKKARFEALLYKKHPALYREGIAGTPWNYYAIVGALFLAIAGALIGRPLLAQTAFGIWFFLTFLFFARRMAGTSWALSHVAEMAVTSALIPPLSIYWRLRGAIQYRVWFF